MQLLYVLVATLHVLFFLGGGANVLRYHANEREGGGMEVGGAAAGEQCFAHPPTPLSVLLQNLVFADTWGMVGVAQGMERWHQGQQFVHQAPGQRISQMYN